MFKTYVHLWLPTQNVISVSEGVESINADLVQNTGVTGNGVRIAVLILLLMYLILKLKIIFLNQNPLDITLMIL